ncbi:MAG: glucosamine-6-phosphate deaminase [Clostridiales bacterium]|nr:glucosamine-6-phosphate deaminase [Clostridiales bacterium]
MKIYKTNNYYEMSCKAANIIAAQMTLKPDSVLGLATGSTPEGIYQQLIAKCLKGEIDFSNIQTVNLDEYVGLDKDNPQSYQYYMNSKLFSHVNIPEGNYHLPNGMATDSETECKRYDQLIEDLGYVDLQLLGLGLNGHIGFNEPNTHFSKGTYLVGLAKSTIDANSRFFENYEDVPRFAYTMGIKTIMSAKKILLVVNGKAKAKILKEVVTGRITPEVPASILQLHNDVTIVADSEALSLL